MEVGYSRVQEERLPEVGRAVTVRGGPDLSLFGRASARSQHSAAGSIDASIQGAESQYRGESIRTVRFRSSSELDPSSALFTPLISPKEKGREGRWPMLCVVSLGGLFNGASFTFLAPIEDTIKAYFGVSANMLLCLVFGMSMMYLPSSILTDQSIRNFGLRFVFISSMTLQLVGAIIRCLGSWQQSFFIFLLGQVVFGFTQCFYLNTPSYVSTIWFAKESRDLAVSLMYFSYSIGMTVGQFASPLVIENDNESLITRLMFANAVLGAVITLFTLFFARNRPSTVQQSVLNFEEAIEDNGISNQDGFAKEVSKVLGNRQFWFLIGTLLFSQAINNSLSNLVGNLSKYLGFDNEVAGMWGTALNLGGITGYLIIGKVMDCTKYFKFNFCGYTLGGYHLLIRAVLAVQLAICTGLLLCFRPSINPYVLTVLFFSFGVNAFSLIVLTTQTAVENSFPCSELVPVAVLRIAENYSCVGMAFAITAILPDKFTGYSLFHLVVLLTMVTSFVCGWCFSGELKRIDLELVEEKETSIHYRRD